MGLSEILNSIPTIISTIFSEIYVANKETNEFYVINYTGSELKVSPNVTYLNINKYINNDILVELESNKDIKKVINNRLIMIDNKEKYQIITIINLLENKKSGVSKEKILVADDSPVITKFFIKTFENDYDIIVASNGDEAIKLINDNLDNNLVGAFIDLQMPIKNGFEVLDYLKENDLFKRVPVSVISGEDSQDGIEKATSYAIVDMLQKPFNQDQARAIVNKTVSFSPNK